jgi:hypothetical protein
VRVDARTACSRAAMAGSTGRGARTAGARTAGSTGGGARTACSRVATAGAMDFSDRNDRGRQHPASCVDSAKCQMGKKGGVTTQKFVIHFLLIKVPNLDQDKTFCLISHACIVFK